MKIKLHKLPQLLDRKIYKTGQTRGADDDVIYQNRVSRSSTVLIPFSVWEHAIKPPCDKNKFENGFIALISPEEYFSDKNIDRKLAEIGLKIGVNSLVFYETREEWNTYNPIKLSWKPASNRKAPLGGQYIARVPATTAKDAGGKIVQGFNSTSNKGAGIRIYEYASNETNKKCVLQLEALFWHCFDAIEIAAANGMNVEGAKQRKKAITETCHAQRLLEYQELIRVRILNKNRITICPFCLEEFSAKGFFSRMEQAAGRIVPDLTVTQINLFHIEELKIGCFNHRPYNLGWGHHHCNIVVKDSGITKTLEWMQQILNRNKEAGLFTGKQ